MRMGANGVPHLRWFAPFAGTISLWVGANAHAAPLWGKLVSLPVVLCGFADLQRPTATIFSQFARHEVVSATVRLGCELCFHLDGALEATKTMDIHSSGPQIGRLNPVIW